MYKKRPFKEIKKKKKVIVEKERKFKKVIATCMPKNEYV